MKDLIDEIKEVFKQDPLISAEDLIFKAEKAYWLYRTAKDNPSELEKAFLRQSNILQKKAIELLQLQKEESEGE